MIVPLWLATTSLEMYVNALHSNADVHGYEADIL